MIDDRQGIDERQETQKPRNLETRKHKKGNLETWNQENKK